MVTKHKQVSVRYPFTGELITVDEGLLVVLELLWEDGVETLYSCEGDEKTFAYIAYQRGGGGERAIRRVIHEMALPYVWWNRREGVVYWTWNWTVIATVEGVLKDNG